MHRSARGCPILRLRRPRPRTSRRRRLDHRDPSHSRAIRTRTRTQATQAKIQDFSRRRADTIEQTRPGRCSRETTTRTAVDSMRTGSRGRNRAARSPAIRSSTLAPMAASTQRKASRCLRTAMATRRSHGSRRICLSTRPIRSSAIDRRARSSADRLQRPASGGWAQARRDSRSRKRRSTSIATGSRTIQTPSCISTTQSISSKLRGSWPVKAARPSRSSRPRSTATSSCKSR